MQKKIVCKRCKAETDRLTGMGVCPECDKLISEKAAKEINFIDLVSFPLMNLETLLASMRAFLGEADDEIESHLLNLVIMAEKERRKITDQLDMYVDGEKPAKEAYKSLSAEL